MTGDLLAAAGAASEWLWSAGMAIYGMHSMCVGRRAQQYVCTVRIYSMLVVINSGCPDDALFQSSAILSLLSSSCPACIALLLQARPARSDRVGAGLVRRLE